MPNSAHEGAGALIARSSVMRRVLDLLPRLAESSATVLIEGETGTGKTCFARALHLAGPRARHPFVVVDCGAIPSTLVESELFGHERGAFTGAHAARSGSFEAAQGGTVLLDEAAELPLDVQPKLLRVLEERVVKRVGSSDTIKVDVRILVATNRELREEVARGAFRADLYYRLDVVRVRIPALRERPDDIPPLVQHFYRHCLGDPAADAPEALVAWLAAQRWSGNVRELKSAVERAVLLGELEPRTSAPSFGSVAVPRQGGSSYGEAKRQMTTSWERTYVTELLRAHRGNIGSAARSARMDRSHLKRILTRHRIATARSGDPGEQ
jgi:DNA-binding NtrC family response regulator